MDDPRSNWNATDWSREMARLRDIKPRPLHKRYGKNPTTEQTDLHKEEERVWNKAYRHASAMQKIALQRDNAAFRARGAVESTFAMGENKMARKPYDKIKNMIEELRSWLPNYDHKDYPTTVFRLLASLPGGEELEDMGYEPMPGIGWQEADQLGRMLEAIENKGDVEDMVAGLIREEEEVEERPGMRASANRWEVLVGNIGKVFDGTRESAARVAYKDYVIQSKSGNGRASGESVTLMKNGEPVSEHFGKNEDEDLGEPRGQHVRALPKGQSTYTIKIIGGRNDGEYEGDKTLSATVKKAKAEFLPNLGPHETLKVVHFDRDGERTIVDTVIHSPPLGGPPPSVREHPYPSQVRQSSRTGSLRARTTSKGGK
jgi:hypothetical protein